jgi:hypothetical protein
VASGGSPSGEEVVQEESVSVDDSNSGKSIDLTVGGRGINPVAALRSDGAAVLKRSSAGAGAVPGSSATVGHAEEVDDESIEENVEEESDGSIEGYESDGASNSDDDKF